VDAATLDGLDSTDFLQTSDASNFVQASSVAVLRRPATFSVGDSIVLGGAQGISVKASCTGTSANPVFHIFVSTDTPSTRFAVTDQNYSFPPGGQPNIAPADGYKEVLSYDSSVLDPGTVAAITVAIVKPNGTALQGELTLAIKWGGQDCHASGMLIG
jgi:hypothetical protein